MCEYVAPMGPAAKLSPTANWTRRVERAHELAIRHPDADHLLQFYSEVLEFQKLVAQNASPQVDPSLPLRDQIDYSLALLVFPEFLSLACQRGPSTVAAAATNLVSDRQRWESVLSKPSPESELDWFFYRACLQPIAEAMQSHYPESRDESARLCPVCGSLPQLTTLRPEGEGARRSLQCSFCLREWGFRRLLCPFCGETEKEKLPYYTPEESKGVRVEACDTCRHYVKSVDLSLDGLAVPLVDEVALSALDVWAADHEYTKIEKNLMGF